MSMPRDEARVGKRDLFAERYARRRGQLSPAFRKVAAFIDANRLEVMTMSALELGRAIGTSDATVVRAVQALGFDGLHALRSDLAASFDTRNAPGANLARSLEDVGKNADLAMQDVLDALAQGLEALRSPPLRQPMLDALKILHVAQRIVVFGLGPTAHIATYFAARIRRKGRNQLVLDRTGAGLADQLLDLQRGDAILMLSYGSNHREAEATAQEARRLRVPIVLITDTPDSRLVRQAATVLQVPRGQRGRVALHGTTLACLEMILLGLATVGCEGAITTLDDLDRLREMTRPARRRTPNLAFAEDEE